MPKQISPFFKTKEIQTIFLLFIIWKVFLLFCLITSFVLIPLKSTNFLGGGFRNYQTNPYIFPWVNFDGEHYLSIALQGYKSLEQAFFPLYPGLIGLLLKLVPETFLNAAIIGLLVSNICFILALIFLYKLISKDYPKGIALGTTLSLIVFPTSFYFQAYYTESLFLFLIVLTFYYAQSKNFWVSASFGILSSATRVFGFLLLPSLLIDLVKKNKISKYFPILFIPAGFIGYMAYQYFTTGDPLAFYNLQLIVGEQHQKGIVFFPQVIYRYIKILLNFNPNDPIYLTYFTELLTGILFFLLPIIGYFKKVKLSYLFFSFIGFILPTIQGSFSSSPRYVLILFPSFLILTILISKLPKAVIGLLVISSIILLGVNTMLFVRGYWVA
jgi:Gpi18-like mannosyltransferase